ncbi:MAG: DUF2182 domain-containing protein, partial [bacterium]
CGHCTVGAMMILLVTGVMDLRVMGVVGAAITIERLTPREERFVRTIGALAVVLGVLLVARALGTS